jgi:hypothetical protein
MTEERVNQKVAEDSPVVEAGSRAGRRRRTLLRVGIVVLVLLLVLGVPAYIATRPSYFRRFPSMAAKYQPWSRSTHVEASCQDCHVAPGVLPQTAYGVRMIGEFYAGLVARSRVPERFGEPTNEACLKCHNDLRSVSPKGDLKIPHRAHVTILKMKCVQCHDFLVHEKSPEGKRTPPMSGCLECHDGDSAKNTCTACHTDKATPATHRAADWLIVHPDKAAGGDCAKCHKWTEDWCASCHSTRPKSHGPDWRAAHGARVKTHRNCEACHTASFCIECHGVLPTQNLDPNLKLVR